MIRLIHRSQASAILGVLVMLIPLSGFPMLIKTALLVLCGGFITAFSYINYRSTRSALTYTSPAPKEADSH